MAERVCDTKLVMVFQFCDRCQDGQMNPTGKVLNTYPPYYEHQCALCGEVKYFNTTYPVQRIVPLETLREAKESEVY